MLPKVFVTAAFFATACLSFGQEVTATVKQEAQNCAKAMLASDFDGMVQYTHPRVVKMMGGKEGMIRVLKKGTAQMQAQGAGFIDATIGQPGDPKTIGAWLTSVVPQHLVMKVPGGKLDVDSSLLGVSEDGGKHWVFIDLGGVSKEQLEQAFPEIRGQVTYPEKKQPVFTKDS